MQNSTAIFTICSNNYLAQAQTFFASVRQHYPEADLFLGLADRAAKDARELEEVEVLRADQLDIPDFPRLAFGYDVMEFNTAIKPFMFLHLFERNYERVVYFDPDIMLFNRLGSVSDALDEGASFVLTPHLCAPPGLDAPRTEIDVMRTGIYNLGFLACSQQPETEPILRWWARKLRYECVNDQAGGVFVDQKFMDLVPGFAEHARVLRDTALNVAYWNLAQRHLERRGSNWVVDGRPLGFFHFSGFDPRDPNRLSKHVATSLMSDALRDLLAHYAEHLLAGTPRASVPYAYAIFASGIPIPTIVRQMYRNHRPPWSGDPFQTYEHYLRLPSPHATLGQSGEVVTNLMEHIHAHSSEAKQLFDLRNRYQVSSYARWLKQRARDYGIAEALLPD